MAARKGTNGIGADAEVETDGTTGSKEDREGLNSADESGEAEEWNGIPDSVPISEITPMNGATPTKATAPDIDYQDEYIDEDKYTTVTVEAVEVSREGLQKDCVENDNAETAPSDADADAAQKVGMKREKSEDADAKKRKWTK